MRSPYPPPSGNYPQHGAHPQPQAQPPGGYPPGHHPPRKKHTGLKVAAGIAGAVVVIAAIGSLANGGTNNSPAAAQSTPTTAAQPAGQQESSAEPATQTTPPEPAQQAKPRTYRGVGAKVLRLRKADQGEPRLVTFTHTGSSNFIVNSIDSSGTLTDGLVNEIGIYRGTVLLISEDDKPNAALEIKADGRWTAVVKPVTAARTWSGTQLDGQGDDVIHLDPPSEGLVTLQASHQGKSNFIVTGYTEDGTVEGLVNEIGKWRGDVLLPNGTIVMTIKADGQWRMVRS